MAPLRMVFDFDGTLVPRDRLLDASMAEAIAAMLHHGWSFTLLTGRDITNVLSRLVRPLFAIRSLEVAAYCNQLYLVTCEGASAWHVQSDGTVVRDPLYPTSFTFDPAERDHLLAVLDAKLSTSLSRNGLTLSQDPEWWEDALLIFKVAGDLSRRPVLADELAQTLDAGSPIRCGVAGTTTLVIARREVSKRRALEFLKQAGGPHSVVYIADEFVPPGNDSATVDVKDVVRISVDVQQDRIPVGVLSAGGSSPTATRRWLTHVLQASGQNSSAGSAFICHATKQLHNELGINSSEYSLGEPS